MYNYRVYNNLFWIFLIQMEYRLQHMYSYGRADHVSCISLLFYLYLSILILTLISHKGNDSFGVLSLIY